MTSRPPAPNASNLPAQLASIVGREQELDELRGLLDEHRLVTITGTGGSGKTRLALELARQLAADFAEGVFFVDLAPISDAALLPSAIAVALGVRGQPPRPLVDTIVDRLAGRPTLLLLDNLEQLPGAAPMISGLLARCPHLRVLATSRTPLHVRGERRYSLEPLSLPADADLTPELVTRSDAVRLFVERARAVEPRFTLTADNAATVADICRRVDGLPLAIELAAARVRLLTPEALLGRLERRLALLTAGATDAPVRQRTLRDTILWSYDLLMPADRAVFARLAVFVGGFTLAAAETVLPDPADPPGGNLLAALDRLVDHGLVQVHRDRAAEPRFRLLETIREFAEGELAAVDAEPLRDRHALYFTALADEAVGGFGLPEQAGGHRRVIDDLDNLRAAIDWAHRRRDVDLFVRLAVLLRGIFSAFADPHEAGRWISAAEEMAADATPSLRADVLGAVAWYEMEHGGDRARARLLFDEALALNETLGEAVKVSQALTALATAEADLGERASAAHRLTRAVEIARSLDDRLGAATILGVVAVVSLGTFTPVQSRAVAQEAFDVGLAAGNRSAVASGLLALGTIAIAAGDHEAALDRLGEAARIFGELGGRQEHAAALAALATAQLRSGDVSGARQRIREVLEQARSVAVPFVQLTAVEAAADLLGVTGRARDAMACWRAADAGHSATLNRTWLNDVGAFAEARERDRRAFAKEAAAATDEPPGAMRLDQAVEYALLALEHSIPPEVVARAATTRERKGIDLTPREREVLDLVAAGRSDAEIAEALFISKKTASVHVANIKDKLGAASRIEIAMTAVRSGLVRSPQHSEP
jgi:predicted ATPase/DNA-binding CsgD family transcriptional regulator